MNYREARAVFLETTYAFQAAWGRSGRKEDAEGKFEYQSIEALYEEAMEEGPKLATPGWYTANYEKEVPDDCIAVLVHDIGCMETCISSAMTMEEFQDFLVSEVYNFPDEG